MISDQVEKAASYAGTIPLLKDVSAFLNTCDFAGIQAGRHDIGQSGCYALVFEYTTKDIADCIIEAHRKYIDMHVVLEGEENIAVGDLAGCQVGEFDDTRDYLPVASGELSCWKLKKGHFLVLYPHEAHATAVWIDQTPKSVKKMVIKIPIA